MKLDNLYHLVGHNLLPVIIQLMTELDVSNNLIPERQYLSRLQSKAVR